MQDGEIIKKSEMFLVVFMAICAGLLSEFLAWIFVYKKVEFQKLNFEVTRLYKKVQSDGDKPTTSSKKDKTSAAEREYQRKSKQISVLRSKANMFTGVMFMILMPFMYNLFEGVVIAKLPFVPIVPFRYLTHSSLSGDDYTYCSFTFIYTFTLMLTKQNVQKILGFAPPGGQSAGGLFGADLTSQVSSKSGGR